MIGWYGWATTVVADYFDRSMCSNNGRHRSGRAHVANSVDAEIAVVAVARLPINDSAAVVEYLIGSRSTRSTIVHYRFAFGLIGDVVVVAAAICF